MPTFAIANISLFWQYQKALQARKKTKYTCTQSIDMHTFFSKSENERVSPIQATETVIPSEARFYSGSAEIVWF